MSKRRKKHSWKVKAKKQRKLQARISAAEGTFGKDYEHNVHHCLWIAKKWDADNEYSRKLRNHEYFKFYIPKNTLHKEIHRKMQFIPIPSKTLCATAYNLLVSKLWAGEIRMSDEFTTRIDFLLEIWSSEACPMTHDALVEERKIIEHYYENIRNREE